MRITLFATVAVIAFSLLAMPSASFANLVTNPGFENGTAGWVFSDGNGNDTIDVGTCADPCVIANTGTWAGFKNLFGGGAGTISQSIDTMIGTTYSIELWLADNNFESGTITASFGDTVGVAITGAATSPTYTQYIFTHMATTISTDLCLAAVLQEAPFS